MGNKHWANTWTEIEELGGGKFAAEIHVGHKVFKDKADNQYKKHKLTDERPAKNYVLIQSAKCCVEIYPYHAKYFDVDHEEVRLYEERWVVQRWREPPGKWQDIGAWNPIIITEETGTGITVTVNYDTDYGTLTIEYIQRDGCVLKHNIIFTNTSGSTETFRVLQRWAGIVGNKCNGQDFPLVTEDSYLAFHDSDKPKKEFNIAENLHSMMFNPDSSEKTDQCLQRPIQVETHAQGMKADFIYGNWVLAQDKDLEIDPDTATLDNPTEDGWIRISGYIRDNTSTYVAAGYSGTLVYRAYVEWDVSGISGTISDTVFKYHGIVNGIDCHIHEMVGTRPSTQPDNEAGNTAIYNEAGEGTVYAAPVGFPVADTNQQVDLGTSADSDLESQLAAGWFAIGIQADSEVANYSTIYSEEYASTPDPTLYVVYTTITEFEYVGTGTFAYSGTATVTIGFASVGSGTYNFSGVGLYSLGLSYVASGNFIASGSGSYYYEVPDWEYVGSGELAYSGEATQSHTRYFLYDTSGNFVYSGGATISHTFNYLYVGDGEFVYSGSGVAQVYSRYYLYTGSGTLTYSGNAVYGYTFFWTKVTKETGDWTLVDKETGDWTLVSKEEGNWTKVEKEEGSWVKVEKAEDSWTKVERV